jgi:hypothetical protein
MSIFAYRKPILRGYTRKRVFFIGDRVNNDISMILQMSVTVLSHLFFEQRCGSYQLEQRNIVDRSAEFVCSRGSCSVIIIEFTYYKLFTREEIEGESTGANVGRLAR